MISDIHLLQFNNSKLPHNNVTFNVFDKKRVFIIDKSLYR